MGKENDLTTTTKQNKTIPKPQLKDVLDPVAWLTLKDADPKFISQVKNAMSGLSNPLHLHPKQMERK